MGVEHLNRWVGTGNLTRDPELRSTPSGMAVCSLRLACNGRRKNSHTGEWEDDPNFFDVTVWGAQGENVARFLTRGSFVAIDGRLKWREYETKEGQKRQAVEIVADRVNFGPKPDRSGDSGGFGARSDVPADTSDFAPAPAGGGFGVPAGGPPDDDIPF